MVMKTTGSSRNRVRFGSKTCGGISHEIHPLSWGAPPPDVSDAVPTPSRAAHGQKEVHEAISTTR